MGIAYLDAMCSSFGVGVLQDGRRSLSSSGSTFAHELGHIFSLDHDTCKYRHIHNTFVAPGNEARDAWHGQQARNSYTGLHFWF